MGSARKGAFGIGLRPMAPVSALLLAPLWALLVALGPLPALADERPGFDRERLADLLGEEVREVRSVGDFPGCVAAVALPDGSVVSAAAGMADSDAGIPMTPLHRFMSGSIGKTFTAAVALALSLDGLLDLDAPISSWLGDEPWFGRLPNGPAITTRMLLRHASGLEDHVRTLEFELKAGWKRFFTDPHVRFEREELVEVVLDRAPLFPAGEGYHYSDTGYILAGLIIEEVAGRSYYEELERRFLAPLRLDLTSPATRRKLEGLAVGHTRSDDYMGGLASLFMPEKTVVDGALVFDPNTEWTGGGLVTNPRDLALWAKTLYQGAALRGDYTRQLLAPGHVPLPEEVGESNAYGLGVSMGMTELGPVYGHGGYFPGFNSAVGYFPDRATAVAIQVNSDGIPDGELRQWMTRIARSVLALGTPPPPIEGKP